TASMNLSFASCETFPTSNGADMPSRNDIPVGLSSIASRWQSAGAAWQSLHSPAGSKGQARKESSMFARILVPTDFSAPSEAALAYGREIADRIDATLHLIHIAENPLLRAAVVDRRSLEEAPTRWLEDRLTDADRRHGAVAIVEQGDEPASEILQYAKSANIDLIVMG